MSITKDYLKNDLFGHKVMSRKVKRKDSYVEYSRFIQMNIDLLDKFKKEVSEFKMIEVKTGEI